MTNGQNPKRPRPPMNMAQAVALVGLAAVGTVCFLGSLWIAAVVW